MKYSVQAVILNSKSEVLCVSRKHNHNDFGLPGGKVDPEDKSFEDALVREVKEETGLNIKVNHTNLIFATHKQGFMGLTYLIDSWEGEFDYDEPHVVKWGTFKDLVEGSFGKYNKMVQDSLDSIGVAYMSSPDKKEKIRISSGNLHTNLLPTYSDFKPVKAKKIVGYKLARISNGNHYSIVTGLFRYKSRNIVTNSYSALYEREKEHFNTHLKDRLSVHKNEEDAINTLIDIAKQVGVDSKVALLEITLMGDNIEEALLTNDFVSDVPVFVGPIIDRVREVKVINL